MLVTAVLNDLPLEFVNKLVLNSFGEISEKEEASAQEKLDKIVEEKRQQKVIKREERKEKIKSFFKKKG